MVYDLYDRLTTSGLGVVVTGTCALASESTDGWLRSVETVFSWRVLFTRDVWARIAAGGADNFGTNGPRDATESAPKEDRGIWYVFNSLFLDV